MSDKYFYYSPDDGFETFETAEQAKEAAENCLDWHGDCAADAGWNEGVEDICFGEIIQKVTEIGRRPVNENDNVDEDVSEIVEYQLQPIEQKTGEFGGFNTPAEQVGNLMRVIYESVTKVAGLDAQIEFYEDKVARVEMNYRRFFPSLRLVLFLAERCEDFIDVYHFIALVLDKDRRSKEVGNES